MDAGVPIKAPVAGIAMGLVYADGKYTTLTDILGLPGRVPVTWTSKVAGFRDFVTALQLDTKIAGLPADVLAGGAAPGVRREDEDPRRDGHPSPSRVRSCGRQAPKIVSFEDPRWTRSAR